MKIPKIAWFHWAGPPMSWLRSQSLRTFRKQNPDWKVRLVGPHPDVEAIDFPILPAQKGDWTRWRLLSEFGGFGFDSDIVFLKPIPDEWLDADLCIQLDGGLVHQIAAVGAVPGNDLMIRSAEWCQLHVAPDQDYQIFGTRLMHRLVGRPKTVHDYGRVFDIPRDALCFYNWHDDVPIMWTKEGPVKNPFPPNAIGVHWYGGHKTSQLHEPKSHPLWIERLAVKA